MRVVIGTTGWRLKPGATGREKPLLEGEQLSNEPRVRR